MGLHTLRLLVRALRLLVYTTCDLYGAMMDWERQAVRIDFPALVLRLSSTLQSTSDSRHEEVTAPAHAHSLIHRVHDEKTRATRHA